MPESAFFIQKVAYFGSILPQNNGHANAMQGTNAKKQRQETHFFNMGCDGYEVNRNDLKQETSGKNEPKKAPLLSKCEKVTFWTVCPYCYYMYEYGKEYEECCLLCQNCRKGFHGLAVVPPPESVLVKRKDGEYYSGYGFFPLGYFGKSFLGDKKEAGGGGIEKKPNIVEISDDSDEEEEEEEMDVKTEGVKVKAEVVKDGEGRGMVKRVKSVPRNSKKIMGRGVKPQKVEIPDPNVGFGKGSGSGLEEDELEFFEGDDDIYVGLKDM